MSITKDVSEFLTTTNASSASSVAPVNREMLRREQVLVVERTTRLYEYHRYLADARAWKAGQKGVTIGFEREVQTQAAAALTNAHELATASLHITGQVKQAGELDRTLENIIDGIKATGPVRIEDLWKQTASDPRIRQHFREQGVSDDLFKNLDGTMQKVSGSLFLKEGKLAAEVTTGRGAPRSVLFVRSDNGPPRTMQALFARGRFERMAQTFDAWSVAGLPAVMNTNGVELADVIANGSIQGVQLAARHKRKLEDTGLTTYAGHDPGTIASALILAGFLIYGVGMALALSACPAGSYEHDQSVCTAGRLMMVLGAVVILAGTLFIPGATPVWTQLGWWTLAVPSISGAGAFGWLIT